MPELKLYTVADLREWLMHNKQAEGLSERVIAPARAWAIIHNPYVKDDDAIVAAIFEDGQLASYTASFPDILDGKRVWWASTLYCYPKYGGKGYGMIVVGSLMEAHEPELTYDRWGAQETIEIFNHFGYKTIYTLRYHLSLKKIDTSSIKGKLAYCAQKIKRCMRPWPKTSKLHYTLRYSSYIDGNAYALMNAHCGNDLWFREQNMLNWILRYPFFLGCSLKERVEKDGEFSANVLSYEYKVVKVYDGEMLVGIYILRKCDDVLAIVYVYNIDECRNIVYSSIMDQIIALKPNEFVTENSKLFEYVSRYMYFPKVLEEKVSLSLPGEVKLSQNYSIQLGDGDGFA